VQRSRPHGLDPSPAVALWKDPARGARKIPLEPGAQGILVTACTNRATRRSADGRWPVDNATDYFDVAVYQVRAPAARPPSPYSPAGTPAPGAPTFDAIHTAARDDQAGGTALDGLARRALVSALEQLRARQAREADDRERPCAPVPRAWPA
jgi:hypothetical protein